jgi:PKD repeat protein
MITNKHPQRTSPSVVSFLVRRLRAALTPSAIAVVALFLLAAGSEDATAKEDVASPAAFSMATANPAAKSPVQFTARPARDATAWRWDFGDGTTSASQDPVHAYASPGQYPVTLTVTTPRGSAVINQIVDVTASDTLKILSAHPFEVTVSATDPRTGNTGLGQVLLQTDIYGIFSIPDITGNAGNPEIIVKMVDASGIGQSYWVFYGALTDLSYTLSVTEVATGITKTYHDSKVGTTVCGEFDTSGFNVTPTPTVGPPTITPTLTPTPTPTSSPVATPTPTPTPSPAIVVNLVATDFQWSFNGGGNSFTMRVGQAYELHIKDGDAIGRAAHGFGGVPGLGIPGRALQAGGATMILTFTPDASQTGLFAFSCDVPSCGSGHSNMLGTIRVTS